MNKRYFFRVFCFKAAIFNSCVDETQFYDGFGKSTLEKNSILTSRRIAHDSIIFYTVRSSKENLGLLGVNELTFYSM